MAIDPVERADANADAAAGLVGERVKAIKVGASTARAEFEDGTVLTITPCRFGVGWGLRVERGAGRV